MLFLQSLIRNSIKFIDATGGRVSVIKIIKTTVSGIAWMQKNIYFIKLVVGENYKKNQRHDVLSFVVS